MIPSAPFIYPRHGGAHDTDSMSTAAAAASDHGDSHDTMSTSASHMMAVFQTSRATSLYAAGWTPSNDATYAATCIFLVVLAMAFRGLLALKGYQERRWLDRELARRYVVVEGRGNLADTLAADPVARKANLVLSENGLEENVVVVERPAGTAHPRPWRLSVDPLRAVIDTVIAGVGYLLMIAVMSMNLGYFLSVLGGIFLGTLLVGRFILTAEH